MLLLVLGMDMFNFLLIFDEVVIPSKWIKFNIFESKGVISELVRSGSRSINSTLNINKS